MRVLQNKVQDKVLQDNACKNYVIMCNKGCTTVTLYSQSLGYKEVYNNFAHRAKLNTPFP
jgi:hypothetical protein